MSLATLEGLKKSHFTTMTDIQRKALPVALKGGDILGAAKTGSGKTLAFIIPVFFPHFSRLKTGPRNPASKEMDTL
jgi:superfamily II DNA/RNA helicase